MRSGGENSNCPSDATPERVAHSWRISRASPGAITATPRRLRLFFNPLTADGIFAGGQAAAATEAAAAVAAGAKDENEGEGVIARAREGPSDISGRRATGHRSSLSRGL